MRALPPRRHAWQLDATGEAEHADVGRLRARLAHLGELGQPARERHIEWNRRRLDRLLVDHLLRCGYHGTALKLIEAAGVQVGGRRAARHIRPRFSCAAAAAGRSAGARGMCLPR